MNSQFEQRNEASVAGGESPSGSVGVTRVVVDPAVATWKLVRTLGLESAVGNVEEAFLVGEYQGALDLRPPGEHGRRGIRADFPPDRRPPDRNGPPGGRQAVGGMRNPLVRAFGKRVDGILDLTAGLGGDAFRLAQAGHRVRGYERNAAIYAVLASGWERALRLGAVPPLIAERLNFFHGEGGDQIGSLDRANLGVYVDPMYPPPRRRSAKPRRELQVLRALLGGQVDAVSLVERAREKAARVVVKRPHHADPLVVGANFEIETKLVRFDVYVNPERMEAVSSE